MRVVILLRVGNWHQINSGTTTKSTCLSYSSNWPWILLDLVSRLLVRFISFILIHLLIYCLFKVIVIELILSNCSTSAAGSPTASSLNTAIKDSSLPAVSLSSSSLEAGNIDDYPITRKNSTSDLVRDWSLRSLIKEHSSLWSKPSFTEQ